MHSTKNENTTEAAGAAHTDNDQESIPNTDACAWNKNIFADHVAAHSAMPDVKAVPQEERCTSNYLLRRSATPLCPAIATHPPGVSGNLAPRPRHCPHQTAWNGSMWNRSMADHRVRAHGKQNAPPAERVLEMQSSIGGSSDEQFFSKEC